MQKQEPQRPATARPSLLSPASGPGETKNILSDLDGARGKPSPAAAPVRRTRKGLMAGTVLALAALGGTAALVVLDANNVQQVAQVATVAQGQGAEAGGPQKADPAGAVAANEAGEAAQLVDQPPAAPDAGTAAPAGDMAPAPVNGQAAAQAQAPALAPATPTTTAAAVAAPAVALATALAVPDQASPAAAIVDAAPAPAQPKAVHKVAARERKGVPARAKERQERHTRVAKAKAPERKLAKEKAHRKPLQPKQASPDNDVELLAALVAHTRPQQAAQKGRTAPCGKDSLAADNAACGAAVER